jgi:hypothetical protein
MGWPVTHGTGGRGLTHLTQKQVFPITPRETNLQGNFRKKAVYASNTSRDHSDPDPGNKGYGVLFIRALDNLTAR